MDITAFKIDKRYRKAYIGNNKGQVYVINAQNGVILNNVTSYIDDKKNIEQFKTDNMNNTITSLGSSKFAKSDSNIDIYSDSPVIDNKKLERREKKKVDKQE